jgi:hypothetical protein
MGLRRVLRLKSHPEKEQEEMRFGQLVVLVTGAASGIGRAL